MFGWSGASRMRLSRKLRLCGSCRRVMPVRVLLLQEGRRIQSVMVLVKSGKAEAFLLTCHDSRCDHARSYRCERWHQSARWKERCSVTAASRQRFEMCRTPRTGVGGSRNGSGSRSVCIQQELVGGWMRREVGDVDPKRSSRSGSSNSREPSTSIVFGELALV